MYIQKETETEKNICYDFMRFGDSSTQLPEAIKKTLLEPT